MIAAIAASVLVVVGAAFALVAALGVVRMPDVPTRIHAAAKAGPLGAGLVLVGVAVSSGDAGQAARVAAVIAFLVVTAPIAGHAVGRAHHRTRPGAGKAPGDGGEPRW